MASIINATTTAGVSVQGDNSGSLQLATNNGTTAVTIDTSQNVGIGVTSPQTRLDISGSGVPILINSTNNANQIRFSNASTVGGFIGSTGTNLILANNAGTEAARIDSSGNLRVGTTSTIVSNFEKASINAGASGGYGACISTSTTGGYSALLLRNNDGNASNVQIYFVYGASTFVGSISTTASTTTYNTSSDYRLKENIAPMTGALNVVQQLKPVTYKWKIDGSDGQGFIAHELAEVVPDCVTGEKDAVDANGNIRPQGIDTSFLVATLTAAIQELKAELDATKAEVQALKGVA